MLHSPDYVCNFILSYYGRSRGRGQKSHNMVEQCNILHFNSLCCVHWLVSLSPLRSSKSHLALVVHRMAIGRLWVRSLLHFARPRSRFISITIGYHRLYSHRSFRASFGVRVVLAILGSAGQYQAYFDSYTLQHDTRLSRFNKGMWLIPV